MYSLLNFHKLITSVQPAPILRMTVLTVCVCLSKCVCAAPLNAPAPDADGHWPSQKQHPVTSSGLAL